MAGGAACALPWQQAAWSAAWQQVKAGRLPHAVMIDGTPGTGRDQFASAFSTALLCEAPTDDGACGNCRACALVAAGSHPDLRRVAPAEPGKAIGVDAVRAAVAFAGATAGLGSRKVVVVSPAERLTIAAFNAFLKCLEEPAAGTVILLVTARGHPIPATIRSRCQRWGLPDPARDVSLAWLAGQAECIPEHGPDPETLLSLAGGRPLAALRLVEEGSVAALASLYDALRAEASPAAGQVATVALQMAVEDAAAAVDPDQLLALLERELRDWLRAQSTATLRSRAGRAAFTGLDDIIALRRARRAGSNPNVDLLRFRAVRAALAIRPG